MGASGSCGKCIMVHLETVLFAAVDYLVVEVSVNSTMTKHSKCALNLSCYVSQFKVCFKSL